MAGTATKQRLYAGSSWPPRDLRVLPAWSCSHSGPGCFGSFSFHVLVAGLRLGVFDSCSELCDVRELAAELRVDADSLRVLFKALAAVGYLEERGGGWVNTGATNRWLVGDDGCGVRSGVEYWARLLEGPLARPDQNLSSPSDQSLYEWLAEDEQTADIFQE